MRHVKTLVQIFKYYMHFNSLKVKGKKEERQLHPTEVNHYTSFDMKIIVMLFPKIQFLII